MDHRRPVRCRLLRRTVRQRAGVHRRVEEHSDADGDESVHRQPLDGRPPRRSGLPASDRRRRHYRDVVRRTSTLQTHPLPAGQHVITLPCLTGQAFYRRALRPPVGPMRIPELTFGLPKPLRVFLSKFQKRTEMLFS